MIRKEAWSFYRTISGVPLCWELEELKDLKDLKDLRDRSFRFFELPT